MAGRVERRFGVEAGFRPPRPPRARMARSAMLIVVLAALLAAPQATAAGLPASLSALTPKPSKPWSELTVKARRAAAKSLGYSLTPSNSEPYATCGEPTATRVACQALLIPPGLTHKSVGKQSSTRTVSLPNFEGSGVNGGYSPGDLRSAYNIPETGGAGQTVAIVDAFDDPSAEADLKTYRSHYGLSECTTANGCFKKVNQEGKQESYPKANAGWAEEISLDLDMVSSICPECHILLVEASSNESSNLYAAVDKAVALGGTEVSNSWSGFEYLEEKSADTHFNHPGVPITVAGGDSGYSGVDYPAASPYVISVGGTTLTKSANPRGWEEIAWKGTGSGCSQVESRPAWQSAPSSGSCLLRVDNDVAAVGDPYSPVSVYDSFEQPGWILLGGTSVGTPIIAAVEAHSTTTVRNEGPEAFYRHKLYDVTAGRTSFYCELEGIYLCQSGSGFDGPTGWGSPGGPLEKALGSAVVTGPAVGVGTADAKLTGYVDPGGLETTYHFEFGSSTAYGTSIPVEAEAAGSGTSWQAVSESIDELVGGPLESGVNYHYRLVASNSAGTIYGEDHTFSTNKWVVRKTQFPETNETKGSLYGESSLNGVSCASSSSCIAVGGMESVKGSFPFTWSPLVQRWAGTEWQVESVPDLLPGANDELTSVSCPSSSACTAVGYGVERWNGTSWTIQKDALSQQGGYLTGVSCPTTSVCMAVGVKNEATAAEMWNGGEWEVKSTPNPAGASWSALRGISCSSASSCVAVGESYVAQKASMLTEIWNGSSWSIAESLKAPAEASETILKGVSCSAAGACTAVGYYLNQWHTYVPLIERLNGSSWTVESLPFPIGAESGFLSAVTCLSSSECVAVGGGSIHAMRWNGTEWLRQGTSGGQTPVSYGVSCATATSCQAVGAVETARTIEGVKGLREIQWAQSYSVPPGSETEPASSIGKTGATLNGIVKPEGLETTYYFEYGKTTSYENFTPEPAASAGSGSGSVKVSANVTGLEPGVTYHYRLIAVHKNSTGGIEAAGVGRDRTVGPPPVVTTQPASDTNTLQPRLNAEVDPKSADTRYQFEYGLTEAYGSKAPAAPEDIGSGTKPVTVSKALSGLERGKTYHYRVMAENEGGTSYGSDQSFATLPPCKGAGGECAWSTKSTPNPTPRAESPLRKVSCYSSSSCTAIGYDKYRERNFTEYWNGSAWKYPSKQPGPGRMNDVACVSALACRAVGQKDGKAVGWYMIQAELGTASAMPLPTGTVESTLNGISCTASNACTAVGYYSVESGESFPLVERYNGSGWSVEKAPSPPAAEGYASTAMLDVSCASTTSCTTVGWVGSEPVAERWNGSEWSLSSVPKPAGKTTEVVLQGVSCPTTSA